MRYVITGEAPGTSDRGWSTCSSAATTPRRSSSATSPRPRATGRKTEFERLDVRDRGAVHSVLERVRPDALVHLAFILNPSHDEEFTYDVDVNGTHNVLEAADKAGTRQVLVTSSGVAYGAFPDNPVPLTEDDPVRGVAALHVRARQDRVRSALPALGGNATPSA